MAERLALRFVSRCQTVDQFARVFCPHAQLDRLSVPLATEPPPIGTRLRATVSLANKLGVIEGDAEIVEHVAGAIALRFLALDPRSRGFLAHLVAHRSLDPAPVPRHLVPMGASVAGGPLSADPALGTCLIEALGGGPAVSAIDHSATTRTAAVPPVARRELPALDPNRAQAPARVARRETPTVTGLPTVPGVPLAARPPLRGLKLGTRPPVDDNETDLVAALPDVGAESDPTIEPPPPGPARPVSDPAALAKARSATPQTMQPPMAPPAAMGTYPPIAGGPPPAYPSAPAMAPHVVHGPPPPMPPPASHGAPPPMAPPAPYGAPPPMATPVAAPSVALSPANVGSAVAGPASAASWPMPVPPQGWAPPTGPGGYANPQALTHGGGPGPRAALARDHRRPIELDGDPDLTEIVTLPRRRRSRRRWPVIVATSLVVVVLVAIAIIAGRGGGESTEPGPAPGSTPGGSATGSAVTPAPGPASPAGSAVIAPSPPPATPATPATPPAVAPPALAVASCTISFASSPPGADVSVDGKRLGTTPFDARLPCAKFTATFKRERYRTERTTVEPRGPQAVKVRLDRPTFKVDVSSHPAGATITVDGTVEGKTPSTVSVPGFENVVVEVTRPGYGAQRLKVYATRSDQRLEFTLRRKR